MTAFGVNAIVYPPGAEGVLHYHDEQDELYFVHSGTARFDVDGEVRELGPGGLCHVEATTPSDRLERRRRRPRPADRRRKDGYVGRDGQLVNTADLAKRQAMSSGEFSAST